jgi:RNA polymerase sigma-70 factor, ECF subfamily
MNTTNFTSQMLAYQSSLTCFALKLTKNYDDANDLVQETYLKAMLNIDRFDQNTNIRAWLSTILKNTFINDYRKRVRRGDISSSDIHEYTLNSAYTETNPEKDFDYKELNSVVQSLDPDFKVPFQMYDSGYRYNEIADELGLNIGTIKSRIHFSRKKIIEKISE